MASRYIFACNYGTHDGNMGQINNKVLTYDNNFLIVKNYVKGFTKANTLRNSIVTFIAIAIYLKNWLQILTESDFFSSILAVTMGYTWW